MYVNFYIYMYVCVCLGNQSRFIAIVIYYIFDGMYIFVVYILHMKAYIYQMYTFSFLEKLM